MSDYREFCSVCNKEINFGNHAPGCPVPARIRAERAEHEWKVQKDRESEEAPFREITKEEELFDKVRALETQINDAEAAIHPVKMQYDAGLRVIRDRDLVSDYLNHGKEIRRKARTPLHDQSKAAGLNES